MIQHHFGAICALVGAGIVFKDANERKPQTPLSWDTSCAAQKHMQNPSISPPTKRQGDTEAGRGELRYFKRSSKPQSSNKKFSSHQRCWCSPLNIIQQAGRRRAQRVRYHEQSQKVWKQVLHWLKFYLNNVHMVIYFILKSFFFFNNNQRGFLPWVAWRQLAGWSWPGGRSEKVIFNSSLLEETHAFGT